MSVNVVGGTWAASILRAVHSSPGISRAQLVRQLGLSSGLATDTVARLRDRRLIEETAAPKTGERGRPTRSLVAHPEGPVVAVAAISHEQWELCVIALGADVLAAESGRHDRRWSPLRRILRSRLGTLHRHLGSRLVALGVSVPGTVSGERLIQASMLGWSDVELDALRPAGVGWPLVAGNDATLSALGEARRGSTRGARSILHLHMDNGIGGALIDAGRLVTGAQGMAGEFGHVPFGPPSERCRCGAYGCWNTAFEGAALARRLGQDVENEVAFIAELFARAGNRSGPERRAVGGAARALGRGIAALVNAHDPELVSLSGLAPALRAASPKAVSDGYQRGLMSSRAAVPPPILDGCLGERAAVIGAAEQAFDQLLADPNLERWNQP
jgi:predicted NBD/HSP70 family sugar kinase